MNKLFTVVVLLMVQGFVVSNSGAENAGNSQTHVIDYTARDTVLKSYEEVCKTNFQARLTNPENWDRSWHTILDCQRARTDPETSKSKDRCTELRDEFKKDAESLSKSCGDYGITGLPNCQTKAKECEESKEREKLSFNLRTMKVEAEEDSYNSMMSSCPNIAMGNLKDWKEQAKSGEKTAAEMKKQAIEEQSRMMENMTSLQKEMQRIDEDVQKLSDQEKNMLEEMPETMKNIDAQTQGAIQDMSMKIKQQQDQILQINDKLRRSHVEYSKAIAQLNATCEAEGKRQYKTEVYDRFRNRPNAGGGINQLANIGKKMDSAQKEMINDACSQKSVTAAKAIAAQTLSAEQLSLSEAAGQVKELISASAQNLDAIFKMGQNQKTMALKKIESRSRDINTQKQALMMRKQQMLAQSAQKTMSEGQKMAIIEDQLNKEITATANANKLIEMADANGVTANDKFSTNVKDLKETFNGLENQCADYYSECGKTGSGLSISWAIENQMCFKSAGDYNKRGPAAASRNAEQPKP